MLACQSRVRIMNLKKIVYVWKIQHFSAGIEDVGDNTILSPPFPTNSSNEWRIVLYPKGKDDQGYISVYLQNISSRRVEVLSLIFCVLNEDNSEIIKKHIDGKMVYDGSERLFGISKFLKSYEVKSSNCFVELMKSCFLPINDCLFNDELTILCEFIAVDEGKEANDAKASVVRSKLNEFNNFENLLASEKFSDVTLVAENGEQLKLHRCILSSKSEVFAAKLDNLASNTIKIKARVEALKELCLFVYAGKVSKLNEFAAELLILSADLSIEGLKIMCEEHICSIINDDNVLEYLNLAFYCQANHLKSAIIQYVASNAKKIVHKPSFNLDKLSKEVAYEFIRAIVKN